MRLALPLLLMSSALAQNSQIAGLILDESHRAIPNAKVLIRSDDTGARRDAISNDAGLYVIPSLSPGIYKITVSALGFETAVHEGAIVEVSQNGRLDFILRLGRATEKITVTAPSPILSPTDGSVGTFINRDYIDQLPLSGRGIQMLIALAPGVVLTPVNFYSLAQQSANGQRPNTTYFTVDGISVTFGTTFKGSYPDIMNVGQQAIPSGPSQAISGSIPATSIFGTFSSVASVDDIQEFRIQTSTFSPEYGRTPGAQVSLLTRSGKKQLSGSIFEYARNDAFNADDWFAYKYISGKPRLRYHNFGGSVGGPLRIPRSRSEPSTFFFFSVENIYLLKPSYPRSDFVPSLEARRDAPAAVRPLLQAMPLPTGIAPEDSYNAGATIVTSNYSRPSSLRTYSMKVDHSFESKGNLFARYSLSTSTARDSASNYNPANSVSDSIATQLAIAGWNQVFGPSSINELRIGAARQVAREIFRIDPFGGAIQPPDNSIFPRGVSSDDSLVGYSNVIQVGSASANSSRQLQLIDNLSIKMKGHLLKGGGDYRWLSPVVAGPHLELRSEMPSDGGRLDALTVIAKSKTAILTRMLSVFAQDVWQPLPRLTMTFGFRWELNPAPRGKNGAKLLTVAGFSGFNNLSQLQPVETRDPLYPASFTNVAPRFGMALRLAEQHRGQTIARAGGGVFYDLGHDGFSNMTSPPLWISRTADIPLPLAATVASPPTLNRFQDNLYSTSIAVLAAPGFHLPRTYEWNIAIQQSYGENILSAAYVGAIGRGLLGQGMLRSDLSTNTNMVIVGNNGSSTYNSLQLQFTRSLNKGIQALVSYAWAHSIDDVANVVGNLQLTQWANSLVGPLNEFLHPTINRGDSDFDVRHGISGALVWLLKQRPGDGIIKNLGRGWSVDVLGFARTAPPSNVLAPSDFLYSSQDRRRPDLVPGEPVYMYGSSYPGGKWLNTDAFAIPRGTQGNLGRNALRLFGAWQIDASLHRDFQFYRNMKVQFRAEFFNVLNHPSYANPTDLNSASPPTYCYCHGFGSASQSLANGLSSVSHGGLDPIFQVGGPRSGQLAIRVSF